MLQRRMLREMSKPRVWVIDASHMCWIGRTRCALEVPNLRTEELAAKEIVQEDLPFWHEAEVGAPRRKPHAKRLANGAQSATNSKAASAELASVVRRTIEAAETASRENEIVPAFPADRMPTEQEAKMNGYASPKEWYVDVRRKRDAAPKLFTKPIPGTMQPPAQEPGQRQQYENELSLIHISEPTRPY